MSSIDEIFRQLNKEQLPPVLDTEGAVLVIAGAGSGKTRVLTSRIANLVLNKGVTPDRIMAITFTNKAAKEMKERLAKFIDNIDDMWVSTIHSMCVRILRRDIDKMGYDKNFTIYDDTDKEKVLKRVIADLNLDADKVLKQAKNEISNAKNECLSPVDYKEYNAGRYSVNEIYDIYCAYENELIKSNALDFDDLLFKTYLLFCGHPEVADYYAEKFQYIHIDEFQDTNKVQFLIAQRLALKHGNIFVVGDDDQSIYGWRGAKIENILTFDEKFKNAKTYKLEQNYRSTKKILELANYIIANNRGRKNKVLWTENEDGAKIETYIGTNDTNEATYTAIQIKNLLSRGLEYKDFAVFMRINALSRAYEQEFTKYGIPYRVFGGFRFYERKEVKDALSYLKLINNSQDNEAFLRSIAFPKRGIGDKTLKELKEYATGLGLSMYDAIDMLGNSSISSGAIKKLCQYKNMIDEFISYSKENTVNRLLSHVLESVSFKEQFDIDKEDESRSQNIDALQNSAEEYVAQNPEGDLAEYLNNSTLSTDTDTINSDNSVTIATIHAVKGLEYKVVFVAGLDEEILPVSRATFDPSEMEEERRLMYVAVTRAKERLYLTRASERFLYGGRRPMNGSRFLKEAQPLLNTNLSTVKKETSYYENSSYKNTYRDREEDYKESSFGGYNSNYARTTISGNKPIENKNVEYGKFKSGVKVRHVKFGEGIVISVKGEGDNVIVDIAFKGLGIKSLSAKYAPMEIL